ncbi:MULTISPECIES: PadR family transcriptional regulator [Paenibacillus]|uniref:PadR family transcriptional regulator n=1 Tax=Paenibacillus borealis TaxID=160799 RepID=A0ABX3H1D6_PAEBO|nr:PadR family transcriptional regulator [Paenibacillus borealis]OMD40645.1 PadR family transcriptional regulator [Paenibacillus borealis]
MTRLLVLGMLNVQPMSGYDVQQGLQMTDAERWGGVLIGSIYHALKKMELEGYVAVTSIEQTGHRQKAIYTITESGKQYLQELISEALKASSVLYPSKMYSGLSFYEKLSPEECRRALEQQRSTLQDEYDAVKQGFEAKDAAMQHNIPPMVMLIMDNMFAIIRQQQDFVEKALALLDTQE